MIWCSLQANQFVISDSNSYASGGIASGVAVPPPIKELKVAVPVIVIGIFFESLHMRVWCFFCNSRSPLKVIVTSYCEIL